MYYLSGCNRGLFQSYHCYVLFLPFGNPSDIMKNAFNFISIYILEKSSPVQETEEVNVLQEKQIPIF